MSKRTSILLAAIFACTVIIGCGYGFSPGGMDIDRNIRAVYVDMFENPTGEAYVEVYLRNAFIDEFKRSRRFTVSKDRQHADAVVSGQIISVQTSHAAYDESNIANEDRISMVIEMKFHTRKGHIIRTNKNLSGREAYSVASDSYITDKNKDLALKKLTADLAEKAYRNIMSGF